MTLRAGDWVEVRSKREILESLDTQGRLDSLPFMPQMFQYCGKQFRVYKRAHKTCDTVNQTGGRWLTDGIHLELRCDGMAYGGCQAGCLIFWKEAWLKPVGQARRSEVYPAHAGVFKSDQVINKPLCSEDDVWRATRVEDQRSGEEEIYSCQATQLPSFTKLLPWWNVRQYIEDYASGNVTLRSILGGFVSGGCHRIGQTRFRQIASPIQRLYNWFQTFRSGDPVARKSKNTPAALPIPTCAPTLQPGNLVRVKSRKDILATLDAGSKNAGLFFDVEQVPYCRRRYRVKSRVVRFIDEKTGKMKLLKTPAVILEGVWCRSRYSTCRLFCPRSIYSWWREAWLEKVIESSPGHSIAAREGSRLRVFKRPEQFPS